MTAKQIFTWSTAQSVVKLQVVGSHPVQRWQLLTRLVRIRTRWTGCGEVTSLGWRWLPRTSCTNCSYIHPVVRLQDVHSACWYPKQNRGIQDHVSRKNCWESIGNAGPTTYSEARCYLPRGAPQQQEELDGRLCLPLPVLKTDDLRGEPSSPPHTHTYTHPRRPVSMGQLNYLI